MKQPLFIIRGVNYTKQSAGVALLHTLGEKLLERGELVRMGICKLRPGSKLKCIESREVEGRKVILIEPEIIPGRQDWPDLTVRWLLNRPGKSSPDVSDTWGKNDLMACLAEYFSGRFKNAVLLTFGMIDHSIFNNQNNPDDDNRTLDVFYSRKAKFFSGIKCPDGMLDVSNANLSQEKLAAIFRKTRAFYTAEVTACSVEAILCGAKHNFIVSDYISEPPIKDYLAWHKEFEDRSAASLDNFLNVCYERIKFDRDEIAA